MVSIYFAVLCISSDTFIVTLLYVLFSLSVPGYLYFCGKLIFGNI